VNGFPRLTGPRSDEAAMARSASSRAPMPGQYLGPGACQPAMRHIFTSRTARDLVVGSNIVLEDRGPYALKGIDDSWQLFAVTLS
jgi:hypothetical protein